MGDYWKNLLRMIDLKIATKPDEYEMFNGSIIFWFYDSSKVKEVLRKMNEKGVPYRVEWDREEGLLGVCVKREVLSR